MKIFFSPIRASYWLLDSFWPAELKNVWFLLSRHDVRRVNEKFSYRLPIRASWWLLDSFWPPKPKNVWFLRRVDSYVEFGLMMCVSFMSWWLLDWFRSPEPRNVWFLLSRHDVRRVHEKFSSPHSSELMAVRVISASWAQKRLVPTF